MPDTQEKKRFALALNKGLQMLSRQNLSRKELAQKLLAKNFTPDIVEAVLGHCEKKGYLNETEKALQIVRSGLRAGHGPIRIRRELEKRGIPEDLGNKVMDTSCTEEHLEKIALKKLAVLSENDPLKKKTKLYRFLLSRGYPSSAIMDFMQKSDALFSEPTENS